MPINKNLAKTLQRVKRERALSLAELAEELGITKSTLECYLSGTGNPRADTLELLSKKLELPITELVSDTSPSQRYAETIIRAANALSVLPPSQQARGIQLFSELVALFSECIEP